MKWHKYPEEKPTEEGKKYLITYRCAGIRFYEVADWSNDLYETDEHDFAHYEEKGRQGFYMYDRESGYFEMGCEYWAEIEPPKM